LLSGTPTFVTIDYPGAQSTKLSGINDSGEIVGVYSDSDSIQSHSFSRAADSSSFDSFDPPGTNAVFGSVAAGINNAGQIVGSYASSGLTTKGFLRSPQGGYTDIGVPGAMVINVHGINNAGVIVGVYGNSAPGPLTTSFIRAADGSVTTLTVPGATGPNVLGAVGINDSGQIVGGYSDGSGIDHGFLRSPDGSFKTIDYPGSQGTGLVGINNAGEILGNYADSAQHTHGFILSADGKTFTAIDDPNATGGTWAGGINNDGDVVGLYMDGSGEHGFERKGVTVINVLTHGYNKSRTNWDSFLADWRTLGGKLQELPSDGSVLDGN
jgi:uncharacterized membrane protein